MNLGFWNNLAKKNKSTGYSDLSYAAFDQQMRILCLQNILNRHIGQNDLNRLSLLDFGCGNGDFLNHFAPIFIKSAGFDISHEIIKIASENIKKKLPITLTNQLDSLEGPFDVIFSITVLQHILDDDELITTLKTIHTHSSENALFICLESVEEDHYKPLVPPHLKPRRPERWVELFLQCGFVLKSSYNFYNPLLIPTPAYHTYRKQTKMIRMIYKLFSRAGIHLHFLKPYFKNASIRLFRNPDSIDGLIQTDSFSKFMVFQARNTP